MRYSSIALVILHSSGEHMLPMFIVGSKGHAPGLYSRGINLPCPLPLQLVCISLVKIIMLGRRGGSKPPTQWSIVLRFLGLMCIFLRVAIPYP